MVYGKLNRSQTTLSGIRIVATEERFVAYVQAQSAWGARFRYKKMFGGYSLYLHGKVVAFACDNQLFMKPTAEGRSLLGKVSEHPPFPGAKVYFRIDEETEDRELLRSLFEITAQALPLPKPKAKAKTKAVGAKPNSKAKGGKFG